MNLNEYLETIIEFDTKKPWGIILAQIIFDSFRKFCIDYIQDPTDKSLESLYELVKEYTDESFKQYIDEIFQAEHFEQFDTHDLCLAFFKKFISIMNSIDENNEDSISDFLDYNIYKFFEIMLSDNTDYWFFPYTYEDDLHLDTYEYLRSTLISSKNREIASTVVDTPIEQVENTPVKSASRAIIKNRHKLTKKHLAFKANLHFSKTRKHRK
jgi:hypothetical protein